MALAPNVAAPAAAPFVNTSPDGLPDAEVRRRFIRYGPNSMPDISEHPARRALEKLWAPIPWMLEAAIVLQIAGGCYLLWLGFDALRHRHAHAQAMTQREEHRPSNATIVRQGFTVGVLNPKSLVFFAAVFPHFVNRSNGDVTLQLVVLGCIFSVMAFCSDGTWGMIAGTAREWLSSSTSRLVVLRTIGGCVMCTLGILIFASAVTS